MPCRISPRGTPFPLFRTRCPFRNSGCFSFPSRAETPSAFFRGTIITASQTITADKKQYLLLLLLTNSCEVMIDCYLKTGDIYALSIGDTPVCVAVIIPYSNTACKFKNLATDPQFQKQGYVIRLMETLFKSYAARLRAMYVGTVGPGMTSYARLSFTHTHTVTGFFTDNYPEPICEDGVLLTDMLYLKKELV